MTRLRVKVKRKTQNETQNGIMKKNVYSAALFLYNLVLVTHNAPKNSVNSSFFLCCLLSRYIRSTGDYVTSVTQVTLSRSYPRFVALRRTVSKAKQSLSAVS